MVRRRGGCGYSDSPTASRAPPHERGCSSLRSSLPGSRRRTTNLRDRHAACLSTRRLADAHQDPFACLGELLGDWSPILKPSVQSVGSAGEFHPAHEKSHRPGRRETRSDRRSRVRPAGRSRRRRTRQTRCAPAPRSPATSATPTAPRLRGQRSVVGSTNGVHATLLRAERRTSVPVRQGLRRHVAMRQEVGANDCLVTAVDPARTCSCSLCSRRRDRHTTQDSPCRGNCSGSHTTMPPRPGSSREEHDELRVTSLIAATTRLGVAVARHLLTATRVGAKTEAIIGREPG